MPLPSCNPVSASCSQGGNATSMQSLSIISSSSFPHKYAFLQISCFSFRVSFFFIFPLLLPALSSLDTPCSLRVSHPPLAPYVLPSPSFPFPCPAPPWAQLLCSPTFCHFLPDSSLPSSISSTPAACPESSTSPLLQYICRAQPRMPLSLTTRITESMQ